jgi:hypothetical protein
MAIANVVRRGAFIAVYNERGIQLTMIAVGTQPGDGLTGYTSSAVSVKRGPFITTYDEKGRQLSMTPAA